MLLNFDDKFVILWFRKQGGGQTMEQNSCGALIKQIHDAMERRANYAMREQDLTMAQTGALLILN